MRRMLLALGAALAVNLVPGAVAAADAQPSTLTLVSSANPAEVGEPVTLTATVSGQGGGQPTGTVDFSAFDRGPLGSAVLVGGVARLAVTLSAGVHVVSAFYNGDAAFFPSGAGLTQRWGPPVSSRVGLFSSPNPAPLGFPVRLTASVIPAADSAVATGTVTFRDGATTLGSAPLGQPEFSVDGLVPSATLTVSGLGAGTHSITAEYGGDSNLRRGVSAPRSQVIGQPIRTETRMDSATPRSVASPRTSPSACSPTASSTGRAGR